ncbi:site-specific integrase [Psychrosphaera aquimarina]|uniref:Site-specific integrase n=1 Tax=Psychrosphaera aquimarina TaxID=2044854 RepID=A0ABU3QXY2_9GAMM|nr:site-specific integrase [Psychrosphaera aquimarina]MDU0112279.1 site-specific integrase [Psychrosphaera aquimarina]
MFSIIQTEVNLGALPSFDGELIKVKDKHQIRSINYQRMHTINKFPLLFNDRRLNDCLEVNLFLEYRYKGKFIRPKKGSQRNFLGGVSVKTINSIAKSLKVFLTWLEDKGIEWKDLYAVAESDRAKEWLPPYIFRSHLIERVKKKELSLDTANLYISHVRQLYEWAWKTRRIEKLPFKYTDRVIKKKRSNNEVDLIFTSFIKDKGMVIQTNDLSIPRKFQQKNMVLNNGLSPFNQIELKQFYSAEYMQAESRRLWADLALLCGLRAFEVTLLNERDIVNTSLDETKVYSVSIIGKFQKHRVILIPRTLMTRLWAYKNSPDRLRRSVKWDCHHSQIDKPLFINRSGNRLNEGSITNITSITTSELTTNKLKFKRSFHDLRSTFATSLARYLLGQNMPLGFIQYKIMSLMGHSNFSTTQRYIDLARTTTYDKKMKSWVDEVFGELVQDLQPHTTNEP